MLAALRYFWVAAKGYRFRPWKSPYLRWRFETFFGPPAAELGPRKFFQLLWSERKRMTRFIAWAEERRREQRKRGG